MAGKAPLAIGTCGTMGSLLKKEIEYFKGLELEIVESRRQAERNNKEMASRKCTSWPGFRCLTDSWRKKKRRGSGIQPNICSIVEVADFDLRELNGIPGFGYHNLNDDAIVINV
ncbi:hypothetical protein F511_15082 [Dorcoceras hygrometricum]|uniref:Uncharacterized protein n=1 Tax=Dorcoceras hygrometricum TaxID=472368 RepID=A0A2Z7BRB1_9LAMI|nr:hypothetical protein F511_15082 [Dorcoceras hygrometricum]